MKVFAPHMVDCYKLGHAAMYTEGTDFLYSNLTPRSNKYFAAMAAEGYDGKMVVFGTQGSIMEIVEDWNDSFFSKPKADVIRRYRRRLNGLLGEGVVSTARMEALHDLGYLPLEIRTIDEGARIGMKVPMLTIKNTLPEFFWLVNYLETSLSAQIWQLATNASIAYEYKRILVAAALRTGAAVENVLFQGHDFSMRGMPGYVAASRSGSGHIASFGGTDTVGAVDYIEDYYGFGLDLDAYFIAGSIPATEHAVSSSNILTRVARMEAQGIVGDTRLLAEAEFLLDYITRQNPSGFCSYVADTYDYWGVLTKVLTMPKVKAAILAREGRLVIRPDSGDPLEVICGNPNAEPGSPEFKGSIQLLWEIFGGTVNEAGFKELDSHIGLIYGDSITLARAKAITARLEEMGFASTNVVFGIGSYTYQCNTRDTFGTAMKATGTSVTGEFFEIYKDPATGDKLKQSAKGLLYVYKDENGDYILEDQVDADKEQSGELKVRFLNGKFFNLTNIQEVRARLA
ncbi:nicotinamide phosphoribosyltransferase [Pseudomonas phage phiK7A1]|uniref:Nicotinamide phosphoribosyltransferase n=1 Tax=Pseudomonas phage phiK7A1 TaxID=2759194 RepID=A0A7H0XFM6_9CAUD|nr:nicotinamide phosphoribosyltransferase [Pseudomonas phage phiK7A1]